MFLSADSPILVPQQLTCEPIQYADLTAADLQSILSDPLTMLS